jgi:hypothetical protein
LGSKVLLAPLAAGMLFVATAGAALAAPPETTDTAFVCPVLGGQAGLNGEAKGISPLPTGAYTVGGPDVVVPLHATNNEGAGSPAGPQAAPGDAGYTRSGPVSRTSSGRWGGAVASTPSPEGSQALLAASRRELASVVARTPAGGVVASKQAMIPRLRSSSGRTS